MEHIRQRREGSARVFNHDRAIWRRLAENDIDMPRPCPCPFIPREGEISSERVARVSNRDLNPASMGHPHGVHVEIMRRNGWHDIEPAKVKESADSLVVHEQGKLVVNMSKTALRNDTIG